MYVLIDSIKFRLQYPDRHDFLSKVCVLCVCRLLAFDVYISITQQKTFQISICQSFCVVVEGKNPFDASLEGLINTVSIQSASQFIPIDCYVEREIM